MAGGLGFEPRQAESEFGVVRQWCYDDALDFALNSKGCRKRSRYTRPKSSANRATTANRLPHKSRYDELLGQFVNIDGLSFPLSFAKFGVATGGEQISQPHEVYVLRAHAAGIRRAKVGIARDSYRRLEDIQASSPVVVSLFKRWRMPKYCAIWVERVAHAVLEPSHIYHEWFDAEPSGAAKAVSVGYQYRERFEIFHRHNLHSHPKWKAAMRDFHGSRLP